MTTIHEAPADRRRQADGVRLPGRRRGRRHPEHRARRDGRQARLLPGDGRRRPDHAGAAGRATPAPPSPTPGSGSTPRPPAASSSTTPTTGHYTLPPEQAVALTDEQPGVPARLLPDRPGHHARHGQRPRGRPQPAPGSAGTSTTHDVHEGCERFFRTDVQRPPGRRVAAGARRRGRQARARRPGRRHRLRPRRLDDHHGAGLPELDVRRLRLPRGLDRDGPAAGAGRRRRRPGDASRWPRRRRSPGRATTW